jgi:hypothetical protein
MSLTAAAQVNYPTMQQGTIVPANTIISGHTQAVPGMYDPYLKLIAENNELRNKLDVLEKELRTRPHSIHNLPGFAISPMDGGLTLLGILWLRLYHVFRADQLFQVGPAGTLFTIGNTAFVQALACTHMGNSSVAVICQVKEDIVTVYDDAVLFPSDQLMIKLRTIWST